MTSGHEPQLQEVMEDPIFELLMQRDGVDKDHIHQLISQFFNKSGDSDRPPLYAVESA